ncbi:MAG: hypothetical protein WC489_01300 [Patescibacteria group bacterium]
MRKAVFLFITLLFFLSLTTTAYARSGCCSWHGGVCGCSCCDGTSLSATCLPYYPGCGGGIVIPTLRPIPTTPICPLMSYYDSLSGNCKCYSGYVASGDRCISQDQACQDQYGFNSKYNTLNNGCECKYGYIWNSARTKCIDGNQSCWDKYGYNSSYDSLDNTCKCSYGYVWSDTRDSCISQNQYCINKYGTGSMYDILKDGCKCLTGYNFENNQCVLNTVINISAVKGVSFLPTATPIIPLPTKIPIFTPTTKPIEKVTNPTLTPIPSVTIISQEVVGTNGTLVKRQGFFEWLLNIIFGK